MSDDVSSTATTTAEQPVPPLIKTRSRREIDAERRQKLAERAQHPERTITREQMERQEAMQQAQQQEYARNRYMRQREVEALEAIAEALHVAFEDRILIWRKHQEEKRAAEEARVKAEQEKARVTPVPVDPTPAEMPMKPQQCMRCRRWWGPRSSPDSCAALHPLGECCHLGQHEFKDSAIAEGLALHSDKVSVSEDPAPEA
jgi:hypothetical protein